MGSMGVTPSSPAAAVIDLPEVDVSGGISRAVRDLIPAAESPQAEPALAEVQLSGRGTLPTMLEEVLSKSETTAAAPGLWSRGTSALAAYLNPEVRASLAREKAIGELDAADSEVRAAAAEKLGALLKPGAVVSRGASVADAVEALREKLHNPDESEGVRDAAIRGLARYYQKDGRIESGFARKVAELFTTETSPMLASRMAGILGKSGDPFVQSVLFEALTSTGTIVGGSAAAALKSSLRISHSMEIEGQLAKLIQDPAAEAQHRAMAVIAFSARGFPAQTSVIAPLISNAGTHPVVRMVAMESFRDSFHSEIRGAVLKAASQDLSSPSSVVSSARSVGGSFARGTVVLCESGEKVKL